MDEARRKRAEELVARGSVTKIRGKLWQVRSQSHAGSYIVDLSGAEPTCTCPDFETHGDEHAFACKHILATKMQRAGKRGPATSVPERKKTYSQHWPSYNKAQEHEVEDGAILLADLCSSISSPPQKMGRARHARADLVFAMVTKLQHKNSVRVSASHIRRAQTDGRITKAPSSSAVFRAFEDPELTPVLRQLLQQTARPLAEIEDTFAVDSTGFSTCNYERWFDVRQGRVASRQKYVKLHVIVGTLSHIITDAIVTDSGGADAPTLPELLDATARDFEINRVVADKAYLSKRNVQVIADHGATPYIPFKRGTSGINGPAPFKKMWALYTLHAQLFMDNYHTRSNVETVFSMMKRELGAALLNRGFVAQQNELLCKCIAHNLSVLVASMYQIGLKSSFGGKTTDEPTPPPLLS